MNVASLELCKELYELSGWIDPASEGRSHVPGAPYYTLGYLLRKLPKKFVRKKMIWGFVMTSSTSDGVWIADYYSGGWHYFDDDRSRDNWLHSGDRANLTEADTPEDAAAKLAIELFKQGILPAIEKGE